MGVMVRFIRDPNGIAGLALLVIIVGTILILPLISGADSDAQDLSRRLLPPAWADGSLQHPLGTDWVGRDLLARTMLGARLTFALSLGATVLSAFIGITLGLTAGHFQGRVGRWILHVADIQMAFPFIPLAILILFVIGPTLTGLFVMLVIRRWVDFCRVVHARTLEVAAQEFMVAARATGASDLRMVRRHLLPNVAGTSIVIFTFALADNIIAESSLSFLGFGVQPPHASLGLMVSVGRTYLRSAWWIPTVPGLWIAASVLAVNLTGDALRDWLDPRKDISSNG